MAQQHVQFVNEKEIKRKLGRINKETQRVLQAAANDTATRAPAQVTKAVTEKYGISKSEMNAAGKQAKSSKKKIGSVKINGASLTGCILVYKGRRLTPTHFKMKPTAPGKRNKTITVEIFKGQRKDLVGPKATPVFLGTNKGEGYIPFQRIGASRLPIAAVKTVGIPQMIDNEEVNADIYEKLGEVFAKRYEHQEKRALDRVCK